MMDYKTHATLERLLATLTERFEISQRVEWRYQDHGYPSLAHQYHGMTEAYKESLLLVRKVLDDAEEEFAKRKRDLAVKEIWLITIPCGEIVR